MDHLEPEFRYSIRGGVPLEGTVRAQGSKNSVLKIIAAALLTDEPCVIRNVPRIADVDRMLELVRSVGAEVARDLARGEVTITARTVRPKPADLNAAGSLRASIVLLGPLLARCGEARLPLPGGDMIGARPLDAHCRVFDQLGVRVRVGSDYVEANVLDKSHIPRRVVLPEFSVTATENALIYASGIEALTTIEIASIQPHVQDLATFLGKIGASVSLEGQHVFRVNGRQRLHDAHHSVCPDGLDAFTFLMAGLVTGGKVTIDQADIDELRLPLDVLARMGASISIQGARVSATRNGNDLVPVNVQSMPYPGIPSDLLPLFVLSATASSGTSLIHDTHYEGRFRVAQELSRMGANIRPVDPHRLEIRGPTRLTGRRVSGHDIRGATTLALAATMATGISQILGVEHILRGHEDFVERLRRLGADITLTK